MLALTRAEVERLLDPDELLAGLERGFVEYSAGRCDVPPRIAARSPGGIVGAMPGHVPGSRLAVKPVSVFPGNEPSDKAVIAVFVARDGSPLALMDRTCLRPLRTDAVVALAVKPLARRVATV